MSQKTKNMNFYANSKIRIINICYVELIVKGKSSQEESVIFFFKRWVRCVIEIEACMLQITISKNGSVLIISKQHIMHQNSRFQHNYIQYFLGVQVPKRRLKIKHNLEGKQILRKSLIQSAYACCDECWAATKSDLSGKFK